MKIKIETAVQKTTAQRVDEHGNQTGGKPYVNVKDAYGNYYSVWNPALFSQMKSGALLDVEVKSENKNGKEYKNIMAVNAGEAQKTNGAKAYTERYRDTEKGSKEERASIEAQTSVNAAVELVKSRVEKGHVSGDVAPSVRAISEDVFAQIQALKNPQRVSKPLDSFDPEEEPSLV